MTRSEYYRRLRALARAKRKEHAIKTSNLNLNVVRRVYKKEGVKIDLWNLKSYRIKAAYFCDDGEASVLVNKKLPRIPRLFAMIHELKHHFVDQERIRNGEIKCGDYNANRVIEIGAEEFAAEFIYPASEMRELLAELSLDASGKVSAEQIVEFKQSCPAPISYQFIVKRLERLGLARRGEFNSTQFQKLEESILGTPFYKQQWFKDYRRRRAAR